jgi:hypothetical protein
MIKGSAFKEKSLKCPYLLRVDILGQEERHVIGDIRSNTVQLSPTHWQQGIQRIYRPMINIY